MYFINYGELDWLDVEEYLSEPWKYLCTAKGEDKEMYDIVIKGDYPCELRYTNI